MLPGDDVTASVAARQRAAKADREGDGPAGAQEVFADLAAGLPRPAHQHAAGG
jgi:hypothetical protein